MGYLLCGLGLRFIDGYMAHFKRERAGTDPSFITSWLVSVSFFFQKKVPFFEFVCRCTSGTREELQETN